MTQPQTQTTSALAKPSPSSQMLALLESKQGAMAAVATKHLTPEKLIRIVGKAMSRTPKLLECTPMSVIQCCMDLAQLGLSPDPFGSAYLIPYENRKAGTVECQLIVGYRGLVELARRSGTVSSVQAEIVREGDEWELEYGLEPKFRHVPKPGNTGKVVRVWALARFKDGSHQLTVMDATEIEAIRKRSRAANSGPWVSDWNEMAKKTAIRRSSKLWPLTTELEHALELSDRTEFDFESVTGGVGASALASRMGLGDDEPEERAAEPITVSLADTDDDPFAAA